MWTILFCPNKLILRTNTIVLLVLACKNDVLWKTVTSDLSRKIDFDVIQMVVFGIVSFY